MLQPLLGITNSLQMMAAPYDKNLAYFAAWSFVTTFLVSFQGFFASLFYCFLNGEVRPITSRFSTYSIAGYRVSHLRTQVQGKSKEPILTKDGAQLSKEDYSDKEGMNSYNPNGAH